MPPPPPPSGVQSNHQSQGYGGYNHGQGRSNQAAGGVRMGQPSRAPAIPPGGPPSSSDYDAIIRDLDGLDGEGVSNSSYPNPSPVISHGLPAFASPSGFSNGPLPSGNSIVSSQRPHDRDYRDSQGLPTPSPKLSAAHPHSPQTYHDLPLEDDSFKPGPEDVDYKQFGWTREELRNMPPEGRSRGMLNVWGWAWLRQSADSVKITEGHLRSEAYISNHIGIRADLEHALYKAWREYHHAVRITTPWNDCSDFDGLLVRIEEFFCSRAACSTHRGLVDTARKKIALSTIRSWVDPLHTIITRTASREFKVALEIHLSLKPDMQEIANTVGRKLFGLDEPRTAPIQASVCTIGEEDIRNLVNYVFETEKDLLQATQWAAIYTTLLFTGQRACDLATSADILSATRWADVTFEEVIDPSYGVFAGVSATLDLHNVKGNSLHPLTGEKRKSTSKSMKHRLLPVSHAENLCIEAPSFLLKHALNLGVISGYKTVAAVLRR